MDQPERYDNWSNRKSAVWALAANLYMKYMKIYEVACLSSLTAMWSDSITCIQDALSAEFQQPESLEPSQTSEGAEASSFYKHYSRASAHQQNQEPHMDLQPMNLCLRSSQ